MRFVGAIDVKVGFIDKLTRQNTGAISFGSMANPMNANSTVPFRFNSIEDPYAVYKEIKQVIETAKKGSKNVL